MIIGVGTDIVDIKRFEKLIERQHKRFFDRVFTPDEQAHCQKRGNPAAAFAKRFAAKEALVKALGTGIGEHAKWQDIAIRNDQKGKPIIELKGDAAATLKLLCEQRTRSNDGASLGQIDLSLSDDYPMALAFVVISCF